MKKYVKPVLIYEEFKLSEHIADCALELNSDDSANCSATPDQEKLPIGSVTVFMNSTPGCTTTPEEYCYQSGMDGINTFKS